MRTILRALLATTILGSGVVKAESGLSTCLQRHLVAVLNGSAIEDHLDISTLAELVLDTTETSDLMRNQTATNALMQLITSLLTEKVAKYGERYRGTIVTIDTQKSNGGDIYGFLTTPTGRVLSFEATIHRNRSCLIANLEIPGLLKLYRWVRKQSEFTALVAQLRQES